MQNSRILLFGMLTFGVFIVFISCKKKENPVQTSVNSTEVVQWKLCNESAGLSGNEIKGIAEDNSGKVWIATESEYNEYFSNGTGWWIRPTTSLQQVKVTGNIATVMDSNTSEHFKGRLSALNFGIGDEMHLGMTYLGVNPGILQRKNGNFERIDIPGAPAYEFLNFLRTDDGLWFGKFYDGLYFYDMGNPGSFVKYDETNSDLPSNCGHYDLVPSTGTDFYINTRVSILKQSGNTISEVYDNMQAYGMDHDSNGDRWAICVNDNISGFELTKMTNTDSTNYSSPINYSDNVISSLVVDSHDNIWISTTGPGQQGLFKYNGQTWTNYTTNNSPLHSQNLNKLFVDSKGNLWIGSSDAGVMILNEFGTRN